MAVMVVERSPRQKVLALVEQEIQKSSPRVVENVLADGERFVGALRDILENYEVYDVSQGPLFVDEWRRQVYQQFVASTRDDDHKARALVNEVLATKLRDAFTVQLFHFGKEVVRAEEVQERFRSVGMRPATVLEVAAALGEHRDPFRGKRIVALSSTLAPDDEPRSSSKIDTVAVVETAGAMRVRAMSHRTRWDARYHFLAVRE